MSQLSAGGFSSTRIDALGKRKRRKCDHHSQSERKRILTPHLYFNVSRYAKTLCMSVSVYFPS